LLAHLGVVFFLLPCTDLLLTTLTTHTCVPTSSLFNRYVKLVLGSFKKAPSLKSKVQKKQRAAFSLGKEALYKVL
jgi:hypothetical protein